MIRWFDEVRLSRHPLAEIGAAFYIREMLGNGCLVNRWDLRDTFGEGFERYLEDLRKNGILKIEEIGSKLKLTIVAPGDKKRERCKMLGRKRRTQTLKGTDNEEESR